MHRVRLALALCLLAVIPKVVVGQAKYTLVKARYCKERRKRGRCKTWGLSPVGSFLSKAGVKSGQIENVHYSVLSQPKAANVEYIAFFASGQQGFSGTKDLDNIVSGAISGWGKAHKDTGMTATSSYKLKSLAVKFAKNVGNEYWPKAKTFTVTFPNVNFNHMYRKKVKARYLKGYAEYLNSVIDGKWDQIKGVYLAGSSRGACLCFRLSKYLWDNYPGARKAHFVVQSIDGVCRRAQKELGTTRKRIDNPLPSAPRGYKAHTTDMTKQFNAAQQERYCIKHIVGGDEVTNAGLNVRSFSHKTANKAFNKLYNKNAFAWYEQQWVDKCHECLGREVKHEKLTVLPLLKHFRTCKRHFGAAKQQQKTTTKKKKKKSL